MKLTPFALVVAALALSGCNYHYYLPDGGKVNSRVLCGEKPCRPGNRTGALFQFREDPYSPAVTPTTSPQEAASQVIGWTVEEGDLTGGIVYTCSEAGVNPWEPTDIVTLRFPNGRSAEYSKSETLDIDVNAAVEADVDAIRAVAPSANLDEVRAKLTSAYSLLDESTLSISARYYEYGLSPQRLSALLERPQAYPECRNRLNEGYELITAAGLLWFDVDYQSQSVRQLIAEAQSALEAQGVNFNIGASVRREVTENLTSTAQGGFQVLAWRKLGASRLRN